MKSIRTAAVLAASLFSAGCAMKSGMLNQLSAAAAVPVVGACGTVSPLEIVDARDSVSERGIRVPAVSMPGRRDVVRPPLTDSIRTLIRDEVGRRVNGSPEPIAVAVRVLEGEERVRTGAMTEQETVFWRIEVSLAGGHGNTTSSAEMSAVVSSRDASAGFVQRMSAQAVRGALARALEDAAARLLPGARACRPSPAGRTAA